MKDWNECVHFSRKMDKQIYKNLPFSQNSLNILLQNLRLEARVDSV